VGIAASYRLKLFVVTTLFLCISYCFIMYYCFPLCILHFYVTLPLDVSPILVSNICNKALSYEDLGTIDV
jgi:hypothetical protein